jgi:hypothetical protein
MTQASGEASARMTEFYFCADYQGKGPRVLVLTGPVWRPAMRKHYGASGEPFYARPALAHEHSTFPNGHPWGWVYKPGEVALDEIRWSSQQEVDRLCGLLAGMTSQANIDQESYDRQPV